MDERQRRKWLILGTAGTVAGVLALALFRSLSIASGSAVGVVLGIIALKHLALFVAVSSPVAAFFQTMKPTVRAHCPRRPRDKE